MRSVKRLTPTGRDTCLASVAILGILWAPMLATAQNSSNQDALTNLLNSPPPGSVRSTQLIGGQLREQLGPQVFFKTVYPVKGEITESSVRLIVDQYTAARKNVDIASKILKANNAMIKGSLALGTAAAAPTGVGAIVLGAVTVATSKGLDYVEKEFEKSGYASASHLLESRLEQYRKETNDKEFKNLFGLKPEQAFQMLYGPNHPLIDPSLGSVTAADREVVNGFVIKVLADTVTKNRLGDLRVQAYQQSEIEANQKQLTRLSQTFVRYAKDTSAKLKTIVEGQQDINNKIAEINDEVAVHRGEIAKSKEDIEFLQQFTFGKMSASEKLAALQSGYFASLAESERNRLTKEYALLKKREELTENVKGFLNSGQMLVNIAANFGVDPQLVKSAQQGLNIAQTGFSAFNEIAGGNYLAAINVISSLFGGGGRDLAAERHAEIMGKLDELARGQQQIMGMIKDLSQQLEQVQQNQKKIYDAIVQVSQQIEVNHREEMQQLAALDEHVLYNRKLILADLQRSLGNCPAFLRYRGERGYAGGDPTDYGSSGGRFPSYADLVEHYNMHPEFFRQCLPALESAFVFTPANHKFDPLFLLASYDEADKAELNMGSKVGIWKPRTQEFRERIYDPGWKFLSEHYKSEDHDEAAVSARIASLFQPVINCDALDAKLTIRPDPPILSGQADVLMSSMLSPDAVIKYTHYLIDLHYYYAFLTRGPGDPLYSAGEILSKKSERREGRESLSRALELVNFSVAQQTLLSGDLLLPVMFNIYQKGPPPTSNRVDESVAPGQVPDEFRQMTELLKNNPILSHNFLIYALRHEVSSKGSNAVTYQVGLKSAGNPRVLRSITTSQWDFRWSAANTLEQGIQIPIGWSVVIDGKYYSLPTAEELQSGMIQQTSDLADLLRLKSRLLDEALGYSFGSELLNPRQRIAYRRLLLSGM
jgi:hypothetical protein